MVRRGLLVVAMVVVVSSLPAATVQIELVAGDGGLPADARVIASCDDPVHEVVGRCKGDSSVSLELEPGRIWTLAALAEGFWAAPRTLWVEAEGTQLAIELRPTGELRGSLLPARGAGLARQLRATFQSVVHEVGDQPEFGPHVIPCTIGDEGAFACELPAGELDVKLRAPGFSSLFLWAVRVPPRKSTQLQPMGLIRGASIVGWVEVEGAVDVAEATVCVVPAGVAADDRPAAVSRSALASARTHPDARGFFQISGLTPGAFVVEAAHEHLARARTPPIQLEEGVEARLREPLVLLRPVDVEVRVEPPADPLGRQWHLALVKAGSGLLTDSAAIEVEAPSSSGLVHLEAVPVGRYRIELQDAGGNHWYAGEVDLEPGMQPLVIALDVVPVVGRLFLGREPLQAVVQLDQVDADRRVSMHADEDGLFAGELPAAGAWEATVHLVDGSEAAVAEPVVIPEPEPGTPAEVEIWLPGTRVEGTVIDGRGRPAGPANISASPLLATGRYDASVEAFADRDGKFVFVALPEGEVQLRAMARTGSSDVLTLELREGEPITGVKLVIRDRKAVTGRVLSATGPVPGAVVGLWPVLSGGGFATIDMDVTAVDGSFEVTIPDEYRVADLLVFPNGYAAWLKRLAVEGGEEVEARVGAEGGTLTVNWPASAEGIPSWSWQPWLLCSASQLNLGLFIEWIGMNPGGIYAPERQLVVIPAMPPGSYTACMPSEESPAERPDPDDPARWHCASGVLAPFGELTLDLR